MVKVELFLSPVCPNCPAARRLFKEAAGRYLCDEFVEVDT
jgi:predicted DsbA family dithiol-disulfide isomerase